MRFLPLLVLALALAAPLRAQEAAVVVHRQPAIPLVSLRLSLLTADPPGYAGAGHLAQHLVLPRLREQAARVGGRVQAERTADAVIYTVTGPAQELGYLAGVLRGALAEPRPTEGELLRASRELAEERLADWETAGRHVRAALRARLFPAALPAAGTEGAAERLAQPEGLREAWARLYHPERVAVVAVGDVTLEAVQGALGGLPAAPPAPAGEALRDTISLEPLAPAEATHAWIGLAYPAAEATPAALSIAARLVRDRLQARLPATATVEAEHWWSHHGQALALVVAAPDSVLPAVQRATGTAVAQARAALTPLQVREAARALRREMLFYSRTPDRMAEVIGAFVDRDGDADAAQRFYAELSRVDEEAVRTVLDDLVQRSPARVEIPAQRLGAPR